MGDEYSNRLSRIPGDVTEDIIIRPYVAGEAIAAGLCVRLATGAESSAYTPGKTVMAGDADSLPVGISVTAAAAAGDILHIQTWGRNVIAFTSGDSLDAKDVAELGAAGATAETAAGREPLELEGYVDLLAGPELDSLPAAADL